MKINGDSSLFSQFLPGHLLIDDGQQLAYTDIPGIWQRLDQFFERNPVREISCFCLPLRNTVSCIVLVMYFLERKLNFYLQSPNTSLQKDIPDFCDQFILIKSEIDAVRLEERLELLQNPHYNTSSISLKPGSGAVILSSSGTSGPAKFVYHVSGRLIRNAKNCMTMFSISSSAKILIPVPISHMYGLGAGLLPALLSGATVRLIEKNNVVKLIDALNKYQPTVTLLTPVVCKMLLLINSKIQHKGKYITAGESIANDIGREFVKKFGPLINLYGSTEMGAIATSQVDDHLASDHLNSCTPVQDVQINIDSACNNEIRCIHNAGFKCYIDKQGNEIVNPFSDQGWYRTRDRGEITGEGSFKVTGRIDHCINRFGFVVSLREIELQLENAFPQIHDAVVLGKPGRGLNSQTLIAICELKEGESLNVFSTLTGFKNIVPRHFVPDEIRLVDRMPRLGNGKVDRILLKTTIIDSIH